MSSLARIRAFFRAVVTFVFLAFFTVCVGCTILSLLHVAARMLGGV